MRTEFLSDALINAIMPISSPSPVIHPRPRGFPNLALAMFGVVLILLASGGLSILDRMARGTFVSLTEPQHQPGWQDQWQSYLMIYSGLGIFILGPIMFAGVVIIPFACIVLAATSSEDPSATLLPLLIPRVPDLRDFSPRTLYTPHQS